MDHTNYPNLSHALLLFLIWLTFQLLTGSLIGIIQNATGPFDIVGSTIIINSVTFLFTAIIAVAIGKINILSIPLFNTVSMIQIIALLLTVSGFIIIVAEINNIVLYFIPVPDLFRKALTDIVYNKSVFLTILLLVIVAPVTEEVLFRGIFLEGFLKNYSLPNAVLLSALFFAAGHLNPYQFIGSFLLGLFFGWLYVRHRSLILCISGHALYNGILLVLAKTEKYQSGLAENQVTTVAFQSLLPDIAGTGLLITGIWLFHYSFNKRSFSRRY